MNEIPELFAATLFGAIVSIFVVSWSINKDFHEKTHMKKNDVVSMVAHCEHKIPRSQVCKLVAIPDVKESNDVVIENSEDL